MIDEQVYTVPEIAKILRIHPNTVRKMIQDGELAAFRVRDEYRIRQSALDTLVRDTGTMKAIHPEEEVE
jgi:excisionase family DNA binding protein